MNLDTKYYKLKHFKFENGETLDNMDVEYTTIGTPKYDDEGYVTNAVVYFHGTTGSYSSIKRIKKALGEDKPFDTNQFFFISLSTLGTPGSSSPSTSGLRNNYPDYTIADMVNFNRQFILECLNVRSVYGVIGNSMGGFEAISWACMYPDELNFAISLVSSYKVGGQNYILSKVMYDIITSDPDFNNGDVKGNLKRSLKISSKAMYSFGLSREYYMDLTNDEINNFMNEFADEDAEEDILDAYYRCVASMNYDLTDEIHKIKTRMLIIGIYEDQYFPPELDAIPMHALIPTSDLVCFNSYLGHVGSSELDKIYEELSTFMGEFKD